MTLSTKKLRLKQSRVPFDLTCFIFQLGSDLLHFFLQRVLQFFFLQVFSVLILVLQCSVCPNVFIVMDFSNSEKNVRDRLSSEIKSRTRSTDFMNVPSTAFNVSILVRNNSFLSVKNLFHISMYSMAVAPLFSNKIQF